MANHAAEGKGMERRKFMQLAAGSLIAWPRPALAQKAASLPRVAVLFPSTEDRTVKLVAALRDGLKQAGLIEGTHYALALRFANGNMPQLPKLAKELDALGPRVCNRSQRSSGSSPACAKHAFGLYRDCR